MTVLYALLLAGVLQASEPLTEVERLRIENVELQARLAQAYAETDACRVVLAPHVRRENEQGVRTARAKLKADIEAAHDCARVGCTFNERTGTLEKAPVSTER